MKRALGVLGGMGPLASADFLLSIYDYNLRGIEQRSPIVFVYSDPTFPDRTETFSAGRDQELLELTEKALNKLCQLEVNRIVIACVTLHHLVPRLAPELRHKLISLPEIIISRVSELKQRQLLIASSGTRATRIFENYPRWEAAAPYIVWPDQDDQRVIHERIYREIKSNEGTKSFASFLKDRCRKYEVNSFVAGCTDIHRVTRYLFNEDNGNSLSIVDPLQIIAQNYEEFVDEQTEHSRAAVSKY